MNGKIDLHQPRKRQPPLLWMHDLLQKHGTQFILGFSVFASLAGLVPDFVGTDKLTSQQKSGLIGAVIVGAILAVWGVFLDQTNQARALAREKEIDELTKKLAELGQLNTILAKQVQFLPAYIYDVTSYHLGKMMEDFGLDRTCRISLFVPGLDTFILRGRHAQRSDYLYKSVRKYRKDEGIVGIAWRDGEILVDGFADPNRRNSPYIRDICQKFGLQEDTAKSLQMKSRTFYARTILDHTGLKPVAVLVIESTDTGRFRKERFNSVFDSKHQILKEMTLDMFKGLEIDPDLAKRLGL